MKSIGSVSLGTANLGAGYGIANTDGAPDRVRVDAILGAAVELGIRALDTAPAYGEAEARIGAFLRGRDRIEGLRVGSKLSALGASGRRGGDLRRHLFDSVEGSIARLGVERLEPFLLHDVEDVLQLGRRLLDPLAELRDAGKIARLGVSVYSPDAAVRVLEHPELEVVQVPVNLLDRRLVDSGVGAELRRNGREVHARSVFLQGLLTMAHDRLPPSVRHARSALAALERVLEGLGTTAVDVALPYVAGLADVDVIVIGVERPEQLVAAAEALRTGLPPGMFEALADALGEALPSVAIDVIDPRLWTGAGS